MKVLVIGEGGREHAIIDRVASSKLVNEIYVIPGNDGMKDQATLIDLDMNNNKAICEFAMINEIDLVIIGPEIVLSNGLSDELQLRNIKVLGPTASAAMIETSKKFAKKIMDKYDIPTAKYEYFNDFDEAVTFLSVQKFPIVIKNDGLAAGKGVHIIRNIDEGVDALSDLLLSNKSSKNGVVIEQFIQGDEFTLMALVNGDKVYPLPTARDFKRINDNDEGMNTGGMGTITPYYKVNDNILDKAVKIMEKTAKALVEENKPYTGILYGGFMYQEDNIHVIEFNARFGDPETEAVLNIIENDFVQLILDLLNEKEITIKTKDVTGVGVVLSAPGYPLAYDKNIDLSQYLELPFKIYHMGTYKKNDTFYNKGGRVLFIYNEDKDSQEAFSQIYDKLSMINGPLHYRKDLINY